MYMYVAQYYKSYVCISTACIIRNTCLVSVQFIYILPLPSKLKYLPLKELGAPSLPVSKTMVAIIIHVIMTLLLIAVIGNAHHIYITSEACSPDTDTCYNLTFSQVIANPDDYFISDTTLEFLPGTYTINSTTSPWPDTGPSTLLNQAESERVISRRDMVPGPSNSIMIAGVNNLTLSGSQKSPSIIWCNGDLGFAFVQVKDLKISNLQFYHCGAQIPESITPPFTYFNTFSYSILGNPLLLMMNTSDISISNVHIHNSTGPGLLGVNLLGNSSISQSLFAKNNPNCVFLFLDTLEAPSTLTLTDSTFAAGATFSSFHAAGLNVIIEQPSALLVNISNVTTHGNKGKTYGNVLLWLNECNLQQVEIKIEVQNLNCSNSGGKGLTLFSHPYNCKSTHLSHTHYYISISNSHFSNNSNEAFEVTQGSYRASSVRLDNVTISHTGSDESYYTTNSIQIQSTNISLKNFIFVHNRGALGITASRVTIQGNSSFMENIGLWGTLSIHRSFVSFQGKTSFKRNKGEIGGAVSAYDSELEFKNTIHFEDNEGYDGGAIAFHEDSYMTVSSISTVIFTNNHAKHQGGAIYVNNLVTDYLVATLGSPRLTYTFFRASVTKVSPPYTNSTLFLVDNTANDAGSAIYGGWVDLLYASNEGQFDTYFKIINSNISDLSVISSPPIRACICKNSTPNCYITQHNVTIHPGQTFYIPAVGVGQRFGIVPSIIYSGLLINSNFQPTLDTLQYTQKTERACTNLSYTVRSPNQKEIMLITTIASKISNSTNTNTFPTEPLDLEFSNLYININLKSCPPGFVFDNNSCTCDPELEKYAIRCDIDSEEIEREVPFWINATKEGDETLRGVIVHKHCPFDYCKSYSLNLSLEDPDKQCAFNRSKVLCGECQNGLSHVLGSSNCKKCSSLWIVLIIAFALAGVMLAAFLMLLNLTVSVGSINGLIFYANILRANQAVFFPPDTHNSFLSFFIAWMNLDLGFEACFYDGMSAYEKTWFQFVFPIYIWLIVILIIISSHYSTFAAKVAGRNAVQVLATLFLISYAKLLQATITIISFTTLEYPNGSVRRVWLYDANVDYLKGKHIPLFMAALLVLFFLTVPYSTLLFFIQCLQAKTKYRLLFWIGKFKPLFDAYTGPYKDKHRYWTGLLLLVRAALFLVFSINVTGDPAINLLAINITIICLLVYTSFLGGPYKAWPLNAIEFSLFLNLGILSSATLFTTIFTDGDQEALIHTSASIAFFTFCMTLFYHTITSVLSPHCYFLIWVTTQIQNLRLKLRRRNPRQGEERNQPIGTTTTTVATARQVPITVLELREPLMEFCDGN